MSSVARIAAKEIGGYFSSLAALIFIAVFLAASLFTFFWVERFFARNIADLRPLFEWMPALLIFLIAAITMRMWSEERRSGTIEFLMTCPVRPAHLIIGKFLACLALVAIAVALTLPLPITVALLGPLDWGPVLGGYLATLCVAAAYSSIGLFVSARTDSQIVSLITTTVICGAFYLVGSDGLTALFGNEGGAVLRLIGSGSRFDAIARGVLDLRDIYYYLSIFGVFTVLNVYTLERLRWSDGRAAKGALSDRRWRWRAAAGLVIANLIVANVWLHQIPSARADLTAGGVYSISNATRTYLRQLQEPLLIRGYFSSETHPLLSPLVPRLQDLLKEYEVAGRGRVRSEIVDPIEEPDLEEEAGRRYGIRPVPFQTASRYQSAVTNSYFDILVQYGDEFETLNFEDLIEVRQSGAGDIEVELRNPEYDITRAIKKVLTSYRAAGNLWEALEAPVTLRAVISDAAALPDPLPALRADLETLIDEYEKTGGEKFTATIENPDAEGGAETARLAERYGLQPLAVGLFDPLEFWFHLLLEHDGRVIQVPLPETLDKASLRRAIDSELKRFAPGAVRTVALHTPKPAFANPQTGRASAGLRFSRLREKLGETADVAEASLTNGRVPERSEILVVAGPEELDDTQLFAIDQFLMRGGTVIIAASDYRPRLAGEIAVAQTPSGLADWLDHHGVAVKSEMVLDPQNAAFPVPVTRNVGGFQVREFQMLDYPHFPDIREGLAEGDAPSAGLGQLTMTWASPISLDADKVAALTVTRLAESSQASWTSSSLGIIPDFERHPKYGFPAPDRTGAHLLGVALEGAFTSYFVDKRNPLLVEAGDASPADDPSSDEPDAAGAESDAPDEGAEPPVFSSTIERSPASARLIVFASSSFLSDDALALAAGLDRTDYAAPLVLLENTVDWSLEDRGLLEIRSRQGRFARSLEPLGDGARSFWEALNYAMALAGLLAVFFAHQFFRRRADARRLERLGAAAA